MLCMNDSPRRRQKKHRFDAIRRDKRPGKTSPIISDGEPQSKSAPAIEYQAAKLLTFSVTEPDVEIGHTWFEDDLQE